MNDEDRPRGSENNSRNELAKAGEFRDAPAGAEELTKQRTRLEELRALDQQVTALNQKKCELEVECIAADAALKAASTKPALDLDHTQVAEIVDAFRVKSEIETELRALNQKESAQTDAPTQELERLTVGQESLKSWLNAPQSARPPHIFKLVYSGVMIATLVVIWAALFIHPILLVVALGLGAVLVFLRTSEQNLAWVRLGAKRHFEDTGLESPGAWEEVPVRDRLAELEAEIEAFAHRDIALTEPTDDEPGRVEQLFEDLARTTERIDIVLATAGLKVDSLDTESEQWLEHLAEAHNDRHNLNQLNAKLKAITAERDANQEALFRFLARQGEAPPRGVADTDALSAGLDRVAARTTTSSSQTSGGNFQ